jgi:DNA polymerase-3 subunit gamma/tau
MLRQRWPEVIQRLASISRATWSLVDQNAQLGGVDGAVAVVVFPTEGLVGAFVNGRRGVDVELAIHEATGLSLSVHAQVGQAGGGASVTTPTAAAALPRPPEPSRRPVPTRSAGSAQEPPEDTPDAGDDGEEPHPGGPAGAAGWPQAPAPHGPVFDGHAAVGEPVPEETDPEDVAPAPRRPSDAAPPARADAHAPAAAARASAPDPVWTGGWTEPVAVIPGSASASGPAAAPVFDDEAVPVGRAEPPAHRETPVGRVPGTPSSGRSAPEGARQAEDAEESAPDADHPAVAAAQDMSASIDDADLESSTLIGLPAVLDILGGTVVEEIDEKED